VVKKAITWSCAIAAFRFAASFLSAMRLSRDVERKCTMIAPRGRDDAKRTLTRRRFVGGTVATAAALGFAGRASAAPARVASLTKAGFQADDSVILIGTLGEASTINPFLESDSEAYWRCKLMFEQFVRVDGATYAPTPGPGIAEDWKLEDLTYTFKINPKATFSDGTDLTADDVAFTITGMLAPDTASPYSSKYTSIAGADEFIAGTADNVSGLEVVDPKTLKVTLATPDASFLFNLRFIFVVPKAQLEGKNLATDPWFQAPVGAGPFVFESWTNGGDFVVKKNSNYYQEGKPALDGLIHRVIADANSLVLALASGEIDGSVYPAPTLKDQIAENPDMTFIVPPFTSPDGWMFNFKNEWLAKKEVRQAICMAIDVSQYADDSLLGLGGVGIGPLAPDNWAFDKALKNLPYDPTKAKELLDSVSFPPGTKIRGTVNSGNVLREDWLVFTQQALKEVGIEIDPQPQEYATLVEAVNARDYEMCGVVFAGVTADPGELYEQFLTGASGNYMGYSNPELDDLLKQARQELDQDAAKALYKQIQAIIVDDAPTFFAWYRPFLNVVNKKFTGFTPSNLEQQLFYSLEDAKLA
jgi:peptide/nickel transport system substrate-binding protein